MLIVDKTAERIAGTRAAGEPTDMSPSLYNGKGAGEVNEPIKGNQCQVGGIGDDQPSLDRGEEKVGKLTPCTLDPFISPVMEYLYPG